MRERGERGGEGRDRGEGEGGKGTERGGIEVRERGGIEACTKLTHRNTWGYPQCFLYYGLNQVKQCFI